MNIQLLCGLRFVPPRHTHKPQREPLPICACLSGNVRCRFAGGSGGPKLSAASAFRWHWPRHRVQTCGRWSCSFPLTQFMIRPMCRTIQIVKLFINSCAGTNGRLDLSRVRRLFESTKSLVWSRWLGSSARRDKDRVACSRRNSAGWMPASMGRLSVGVGRKHPVTIRKALLMTTSI